MTSLPTTSPLTSEEAVLQWRSQPELVDLVQNCYFDEPIYMAAQRFAASDEWKSVKKILPPLDGCTVLDVGAGRGVASYAFVQAGAQVTALEPDPSDVVGTGALRRLKTDAHLVALRIIEERGESLPFEGESFDIAYARQVLHHAADLSKFCAEMFRVLKKGGIFLACREHVVKNEQERKIFLENHSLHKLTMAENAFRLDEYCEAIRQAGFHVRYIGPWESAINLFPGSVCDVKEGIAAKLGLPIAPLIPDWLAYYAGRYARSAHCPGCLYTFICKKQ